MKTNVVPVGLLGLVLGCGAGSDASPRCGDGIVQDDEVCDDRNTVEGDGCNTDCRVSGSLQWCVEVEAPAGIDYNLGDAYAFDGGVLVAADRKLPDSDRYVGWLIALNSSGELVWERQLDHSEGRYFRVNDITPGADASTAMLAGGADSSPKNEAWLAEVDLASGELLRERRYVDAAAPLSLFTARLTERGLVVSGSATPDAWIASLDADWSIVWEHRFSYEGGSDGIGTVIPLPTGDLAALGIATSAIDTLDQPPYRYLFYRVFDSKGELKVDVTPAGSSPQHSRLGGAVPWNDGLLAAHLAGSSFAGSQLWLLGDDGQVTEQWDSPDQSRMVTSLSSRPTAVFAAGSKPEDGSYDLRWLARLEPDLASFAWEYVGPPGVLYSIASATDEPAIYALLSVSRPEGSADAAICKFSE